jgi:hypothetical protein
LILAL